MKYDFVEIGTSDFNTLTQKARKDTRGLSVDAVKTYLDRLPDKPFHTKIHSAITHDKKSDHVDVYYIPPSIIKEHGLPHWVSGCNSIGAYHPHHLQKRNLKGSPYTLKKFVKIDKVPLKNYSELIIENEATDIDFLKIDTEGHDCTIMSGVYDFYKNNNGFNKPSKILFETNRLSDQQEVKNIKALFHQLGYKAKKTTKSDTVLRL
tara:strand:- start:9363 stop:9980 length:618 start_codon:yes stop_codon:yes gene_type:complete